MNLCLGVPYLARPKGRRFAFSTVLLGVLLSALVPGTFGQLKTSERTYDFNLDGLANIGLLPDFIQDLKNVGLSDEDLEPLFSCAEAYAALREKIGARQSPGS